MDQQRSSTSDRELILRTVAEADRRLRAARFIRELLLGSTLVLYLALLLQVIAHVMPVAPTLALASVAIGLPVIAAGRAWAIARRRALHQAAAVLDRRAALDDELRSAHWFASHGTSSPPLDLHIGRAAASAAGLDLRQLLPTAAPRRLATVAAAVLIALIAVSLVPVDRTRALVGRRGTVALTDAERAQLDAIARALSGDAMQSKKRTALKARIDELLRRLREERLSAEETLALVDELRQLTGAALAMTSGAEHAALGRAGDALAEVATGDALGAALRDGRLDDAAQRMRELAASIEDALRGGTVPAGLLAALARASAETRGSLDRFAADLADAITQIGGRRAADAKAALDRAAAEIDELARAQELEAALRTADRQLDDLERSIDGRVGAPRQTGETAAGAGRRMVPSPAASRAESTRMPGERPGRPVPGAASQEPGAAVAPGEPGSSAPGPLGAPSLAAAGAPGTIDVTRRREVLPVEPPPDEGPKSRTVDEATRATRVTVEYRPVGRVPPYADAERLTPAEVPWPYRDLVRSYFRVIGPRGQKDR